MAKSYLIYEKRTREQLPVALFYTQRECAEFLGVGVWHLNRIIKGEYENPYYGIFIDIYDEKEGQCTATTAPSVQCTKGVCL